MATKLSLVTPTHPAAKPARKLGRYGADLWRAVMRDYAIADSGGLEMLCAACQALDRAESCREQIDKDGEIVRSKSGPREHPLLKAELSNRAFTSRTLARLGLDVEAVKSVGRPGARVHWEGE
ncbi:MAG: P27 family phage terminase small subunit [Xanthobacteraceae bacterium]